MPMIGNEQMKSVVKELRIIGAEIRELRVMMAAYFKGKPVGNEKVPPAKINKEIYLSEEELTGFEGNGTV